MKPIRLRSNAFYHRLTDTQRRCFNAGLPTRYMGKLLRDLNFTAYTIGEQVRRIATPNSQRKALIDFTNRLSLSENYNCIMALHSSPTDEAAFYAAAAIFETAVSRGLSCHCLSTSQLLTRDLPDPREVYIIHGVTDISNPQAMWAVRDFLRDRDGSLRIVVMTSGKDQNVDEIIHEQMRMQFDFLFCLTDSVEDIAHDRRPTYRKLQDKVSLNPVANEAQPTYRKKPNA